MDVRKKYMGTELSPTGDPLIDMWERQIAAGEVPDLDACEDPKSKARDLKIQEEARRHFEETGERLYIPATPVFVEHIEKLREEGLPGFDVEDYHEEVLKQENPFLRPSHSSVNRFEQDNPLRDVSPEAFDEFLNAARLFKK